MWPRATPHSLRRICGLPDYRCHTSNSAYSPSRRLHGQFIKQCLGVLQVGAVEPLGEPAVDFAEHSACFVAAVLQCEQASETDRGAQLPGFGALPARDFDRMSKTIFGLRNIG